MRKFESSQKDESRAESAGSSKAYRKPSKAFNCQLNILSTYHQSKCSVTVDTKISSNITLIYHSCTT